MLAGLSKRNRLYIDEWEKDLVKYREKLRVAKDYDQKYYAENNIQHCEKRLRELKEGVVQ